MEHITFDSDIFLLNKYRVSMITVPGLYYIRHPFTPGFYLGQGSINFHAEKRHKYGQKRQNSLKTFQPRNRIQQKLFVFWLAIVT
jgi:hypothetical protein